MEKANNNYPRTRKRICIGCKKPTTAKYGGICEKCKNKIRRRLGLY